MAKINPSDPSDFANPSKWHVWRRRFVRYASAAKLDREPGEVQFSTLLYAVGPDAESVYDSFRFAESEDEDALETVMSKFDSYFVPKRNLLYESAVINKRPQLPGKSVEAFVRKM